MELLEWVFLGEFDDAVIEAARVGRPLGSLDDIVPLQHVGRERLV